MGLSYEFAEGVGAGDEGRGVCSREVTGQVTQGDGPGVVGLHGGECEGGVVHKGGATGFECGNAFQNTLLGVGGGLYFGAVGAPDGLTLVCEGGQPDAVLFGVVVKKGVEAFGHVVQRWNEGGPGVA